MKHLIETADPSGLPTARYDRIILNSTTNDVIVRGGVTYEVVPDSYIYNKTDHKYYQKLVGYGEPIETNATVDLNSEWIPDSEDNKYSYFKSDSYDSETSFSQCKVTWSNLTSVTFKYMSNSEMGNLFVGNLDGKNFTSQTNPDEDVYLSTIDTTPKTYNEFTIECDEGEHHIWFVYVKYEGATDEDRGFIGVQKSVTPILDVKQGAELPTVYKSGGVSVEGGKTYDINFNNVTLPNSNIVPSYEDYTKTEKTINYEYVDLGLPSRLKWATCNIGATSETEDGVFFQWGDISGISGSLVGKYSNENYSWATYQYCNGSETTLTKYNTDRSHGTVDNIETLESVDDAASHIMGGEWRMPTKDEILELLDGTTNEWISNYKGSGKNGRKFTSKNNGNSIFIPAAGGCSNGSVLSVGSAGGVWSSSLDSKTSGPDSAWYLSFASGFCGMSFSGRYRGRAVRGVRK